MDISWKFTEWNSGAWILYSSYETIHRRGAKYSWTDFFSIIWLDATLNIPAQNDARNYLGKARHELEKSNKTLHTVPVTVTIFSHPFFHHLKKRRHVFGQNNLIIKKKSSLHNKWHYKKLYNFILNLLINLNIHNWIDPYYTVNIAHWSEKRKTQAHITPVQLNATHSTTLMHGEWDIKDAYKSTAHNLYEGLSHDHGFKLPEGTKNQCSHKNILWIMKLLICFPKYLQYFLLLSYSLFFICIFFVSLVTIPMYPWHAPTWKKRFNSSQFFTGKKKRKGTPQDEKKTGEKFYSGVQKWKP